VDKSRGLEVICPMCGAVNPGAIAFCGSCGSPLRGVCHHCGSANPESFQFCGNCGMSLIDPAQAQSEPRDRAEYRQLTVMFCDLEDSTALAERLGPEVYRDVIHEYHAACAEVIRRFSGHVAQYLGDGLLVYFGYPQAHEDDAQRAVHSALGIVRSAHSVNERLLHEREIRLAVRIGIHTGPVVAGAVGAGGRRERLAVGQTPNIASRLQMLAAPGTVLISGATHALVRGFFVCEALGPQVLRGVSQLTEVFQVQRDTGARSRFEVAEAAGLTPPVNRHQELATLAEVFERVLRGAGEEVWVVGDAGIGKSRLLQMFHERPMLPSPFWALCRCGAYSQHSALHPVIELFERLFGFEADEAPAERLAKLETALPSYGPLAEDATPILGALLSLTPPAATGPLNLAPERQRERTFEILIAILLRMAERQPLILAVEDLHWADPSTGDFLSRVRERATSARIMMILTHRPIFAPSSRPGPGATHIRLDRLTDEHVRTMVEHIAGGRPLPDDVHRYIVEKTDGVPIFVEELTRAVLEAGWLVETDEGYATSRPVQTVPIPVSLQDLLLARLDRLGGAKDLALLASVLGREFTYGMIRGVVQEDEATLARDLEQLVSGGLLYQAGEPPAARYMFKHVLIQDAAYGLLLKSRRQQYHRRVAETLAQEPATVETQPELLAHHFTEAGMVEPAVAYWLSAGQRAVERSANVEASAHARQGLTLLEQVPASPGRDALELGLQSTLGSATIALRGYGAAPVEKAFARAVELCQRLGDAGQRMRAGFGLWTYYVVRGHYERAVELADDLLAIARQQPRHGMLVQAYYCSGFSRFQVGELGAAHAAFGEGASVPCRDDDPSFALPTGDDVRIHLLAFSGLALWHLGQPTAAFARCQEALALARRLRHPYGIAFSANVAAFLGINLRDVESARVAAAETVALASDKGYRYFMLLGAFVQAWAQTQGGTVAEGLATMDRCLKGLRASGARMAETFMVLQLGEALHDDGQKEAARTRLLEAQETVNATGERLFEPEVNRALGECDADPGTADRYFRLAFEQARSHGDCALELRAATSLARLWSSDATRRAEVRARLFAATARFSPADSSADLRDARTILDSLT
jgi:class 3 adenylate cyclase